MTQYQRTKRSGTSVLSQRLATAGTDGYSSGVTGDSNDRFVIDADGKHWWGPGNAALDSDFARLGVGIVGSTGNVRAQTGAAGQVAVGAKGPASQAGLTFGSAEDTNLYRSAADTLRTDDDFTIGLAKALIGRTSGDTTGVALIQLDNSVNEVKIAPGTGSLNGLRFWAGAVSIGTVGGTGMQFADGVGLTVGSTNGTKIGLATTQKLGFWGTTPVVQPAGIADADGTLADITTKFNSLITKLETIGLLATV